MSDTLIAAGLSVVAGVILAPFANYLFGRYRERRHLIASLSVYESPLPLLLKTHLREKYWRSEAVGALSREQVDILASHDGYMKLTLRNPSNKKLNAVTVVLGETLGGRSVCQIESQPELLGPEEKKILLGDLQPSQSRTLHIWSASTYVGWHHSRLAILFEITADEFDKRSLRLPLPYYLKSRVTIRVLNGFSALVWLFVILLWTLRLFHP